MKFRKENKKRIRNQLHNYFLPVHKHFGVENARTVAQVTQHLDVVCRLNLNEDRMELFKIKVSSMVHNLLMTSRTDKDGNEKNLLYLEGLDCEIIGNTGYYYFPKSREEVDRIRKSKQRILSARKKSVDLRYALGLDFINQLEYKPNEATMENEEESND